MDQMPKEGTPPVTPPSAEPPKKVEPAKPVETPSPLPEKPKSNLVKNLLIIFAVLLFSGAIAFGAYQYGLGKRAMPTASPSPSPTAEEEFKGIEIKENTVSFAEAAGTTYLRYRGKVYTEQKNTEVEANEVLVNEDDFVWMGLVDAPLGIASEADFNRLFSFRETTEGKFVFVMRWDTGTSQKYHLFYFDKKVVKEIALSTSEGYSVPKIAGVSTDGNFINIDLFGCWNCGGHKPETLVLNLLTSRGANVGKTIEFTWGESGKYSYKEYIVKECDPPAEGPLECFEEAETLPLKTGQI